MDAGRIKAFDWLRGFAVIVMVQTHAVSLIRPELRALASFHWVDFIDGLVAPSFLFASGFSLALVQVRAASKNRVERLKKTAWRLGEVLLIATLLNALWFPIFQEPHWLYRLDILHCLGLSLFLALPVVWWLAPKPGAVTLALGVMSAAAFALSPFGESVTGWPARFTNEASGSLFPVLPWCGHVFLGAAVGAFVAKGRTKLALAVIATAALGFALYQLTPVWTALYPKHVVWRTGPGPHGLRFMYVCFIALALMAAEAKLGAGLPRVRKFVDTFGQNSLAAYVFHLLFLFYEPIHGASFRAQWGASLDFQQHILASLALIALTFLAVHSLVLLQQHAEKESADPLRLARPPFMPHEVINESADSQSNL